MDIPDTTPRLKAPVLHVPISAVVPVNSLTTNPTARQPADIQLCFRVADYFASDLATKSIPTLKPQEWLTDYHMSLVISHIRTALQPKRTALIQPCVVEAALCSRPIWHETFRDVRAQSASQVVLFLNNQGNVRDFNAAKAYSGDGSHWSIFTLSLETGVACHWDSQPHDQTDLKIRKLHESLTAVLSVIRGQKYSEVQHKTVFLQTDGYNCGIYAWMHAMKFICDTENICLPLKSNVVEIWRQHLTNCIGIVNLVVNRRKRVRTNS